MDELIKQVSARAGISEDQARSAVNTVVDFIKARLPEPIAGQIENAMTGEGDGIGGTLGDLASKAGGLFGK
jgi:uncharacterized protein (DUF2267 family)